MAVLLDTGAVYAFMDRRDRWHERVFAFLSSTDEHLFLPQPVLAEACYLISRNLGTQPERNLLLDVHAGRFELTALTTADVLRAHDLLARYDDLRLGFVDASVAALAERLAITRIATTDRRDFSVIRPSHCDHFELLP